MAFWTRPSAYSELPQRAAAHSPRSIAVALALTLSGCIWIDDFGKFKDTGERDASTGSRDAGKDAPTSADAASGADAGKCRDVDCTRLDSACTHGVCDPDTGECASKNVNDGQACFDGNPCSYDEHCSQGKCQGKAIDCSAFDNECSQGVCDTEHGGCTYGPNSMSKPCDDKNPCTQNDRCGADGQCHYDTFAPKGTTCNDFESCTGTDAAPDNCDGQGTCSHGGAVAAGTSCDDDNTCTDADKCDGDGNCQGSAVREGQPCNEACTENTRCQTGECKSVNDAVLSFDKRCVLNFCGISNICQPEWKNDRVCECGCNLQDSDCSDCSPLMCQNNAEQGHRAERWCDQVGKPVGNCPDSLKSDGKCDCGCQFVDPDCGGGSCCKGTGKAGCDDTFIENCVCKHETNAAQECCDSEWTQRCADLAVNLGCMTCP